ASSRASMISMNLLARQTSWAWHSAHTAPASWPHVHVQVSTMLHLCDPALHRLLRDRRGLLAYLPPAGRAERRRAHPAPAAIVEPDQRRGLEPLGVILHRLADHRRSPRARVGRVAPHLHDRQHFRSSTRVIMLQHDLIAHRIDDDMTAARL